MQAKVVWIGLLVAFMLHIFQPCFGHAQTRQRPLSVSEVEELLQVGVSPQRVGAIVTQQGINFGLTAPIRARLTKVGANTALLRVIEASAPTAPPPVFQPQTDPDPIKTLLALAKRQEEANRLTTPANDNAWESYQKILQRVPDQPEALAGIRRIRSRYVAWAEREERKGNWTKAQEHYQKVQALDPQGEQDEKGESIRAARARVQKKLASLDSPASPASPPPSPSLSKHAPIIARRLPDEQQLVIQQGTSRAFLAEATDPDNDIVTYRWEVDNQPVSASDMHFTFTPQDVGTRLVRLTVTDTDGLASATEWSVQVQPREAQLRLLMFTPHARRFSLFPHQLRFFTVQVEVPGWPEPTLQYAWQVNGQPVSDNEIFEWQDPPLGTNEIQVTVATPSGQQLTHEWTVEVRGPKKNEDIPPVWWPRTQVSGRGNITTAESNQAAIPLSGKVRNYDAERAAENIIVEVTVLDPDGQQLARHIAIPSPQPLLPEQEGSFHLNVANRYAVARFRYRTISKDAAEEDPKKLKDRLVQRADQAQQAGQTADAIALLETAIQVYPPDIRQLEARLNALQKVTLRRPATP